MLRSGRKSFVCGAVAAATAEPGSAQGLPPGGVVRVLAVSDLLPRHRAGGLRALVGSGARRSSAAPYSTPEALGELPARDIKRWRPVVAASGSGVD